MFPFYYAIPTYHCYCTIKSGWANGQTQTFLWIRGLKWCVLQVRVGCAPSHSPSTHPTAVAGKAAHRGKGCCTGKGGVRMELTIDTCQEHARSVQTDTSHGRKTCQPNHKDCLPDFRYDVFHSCGKQSRFSYTNKSIKPCLPVHRVLALRKVWTLLDKRMNKYI